MGRFENPKFISRQPKRKKLKKNNVLPITNEIESVARKKPLKQKLRNFQATGNHANILNTNFRFAYLKRMRQKLLSDENSNDEERNKKNYIKMISIDSNKVYHSTVHFVKIHFFTYLS